MEGARADEQDVVGADVAILGLHHAACDRGAGMRGEGEGGAVCLQGCGSLRSMLTMT